MSAVLGGQCCVLMKNHILNIEGIPGSGKSSTSAQWDNLFRAHGIDSYWVREVDPNHPLHIALQIFFFH